VLLLVVGTIADCDDDDAIADWDEAHLGFLHQHLPYAHGVRDGRWLTILMNHINPALDVARAAQAVRGHWGIENRLHWVLDVSRASARAIWRSRGISP
jgi:hypothetical protein